MSKSYFRESSSSKRAASPSLDAPPPKRKLPWLMSQATSPTMSRHSSQELKSALEASKFPALSFYIPSIFTIHHNILVHYSRHFRKMLDADPKSHKVGIFGCHTAFGLLQNWFYTQKIEGPAGEIKLMEYVKLWKLSQALGIEDLKHPLFDRIMSTKPSTDDESGNTLRDFQIMAYEGTEKDFRESAISKTFAAMKRANTAQIYEDMPEAMRTPFTLALMHKSTCLLGWDSDVGLTRATGATGNLLAQVPDVTDGEKKKKRQRGNETTTGQHGCSNTEGSHRSDDEDYDELDDVIIPETELYDHDDYIQAQLEAQAWAKDMEPYHESSSVSDDESGDHEYSD
ncbi:hypothetical protein VTL71DRAFT_1330 [Oculimacula yallundae]|uniref:BTB domain-containing protein n=1 Tax=Oculimacula yallundae TaxID=86028 RepID=A0ABR4CBR2_9HELO